MESFGYLYGYFDFGYKNPLEPNMRTEKPKAKAKNRKRNKNAKRSRKG